ncbi:hypothetical protein RI129_012387 [Pyrocoelia pectoralis]|uniref:Uncharacterized protein n=1 Tax=Pyrocoelia pectoralis TaxID=417401 RepID=A0AAN7ZC31_9COLE
MSFNTYVPTVTMFADYDFDGYILFLPMVGNGKVTITTINVTLEIDMAGEVVTIKEERYAKLNSLNISMDPFDCKVEFTNLFNGDEQLGAEMNHILSANCLAIYHDVRAGYEESGAAACKSFLDQLFTKVPYNNLFPL